jgi:GAF domain-containing protein
MIRPEDFNDAVLELSSLLLGEESTQGILQRIVDLTQSAVPGCAHCGLSLLTDSRVTTAAATDGTTLQLDGSQYTNNEGPCLEAAALGETVRVHDFGADDRYPRFAVDALRLGIHSSVSLPLQVRDRTIGALNLYGTTAKAFDETAEVLASRFARQAAATLANAEIHERTVTLVTQLNQAMASRSTIDLARGILIATTGCDADEAFNLLKQQSQHENIKLRDVAAEIVRNHVNSHRHERQNDT